MYTIQLLDIVTTAGILYIVALGLLIVYGVLTVQRPSKRADSHLPQKFGIACPVERLIR